MGPMEPSIERIEARIWSRPAVRDSGALRLAIPRFRHVFGAARSSTPWSSRSWVHHHPRSAEPAATDHPAVPA
jgi:hypothetical protein